VLEGEIVYAKGALLEKRRKGGFICQTLLQPGGGPSKGEKSLWDHRQEEGKRVDLQFYSGTTRFLSAGKDHICTKRKS